MVNPYAINSISTNSARLHHSSAVGCYSTQRYCLQTPQNELQTDPKLNCSMLKVWNFWKTLERLELSEFKICLPLRKQKHHRSRQFTATLTTRLFLSTVPLPMPCTDAVHGVKFSEAAARPTDIHAGPHGTTQDHAEPRPPLPPSPGKNPPPRLPRLSRPLLQPGDSSPSLTMASHSSPSASSSPSVTVKRLC